MASYKDRILQVIDDSKVGLTTVDVAKRAGVSKTTVIKYLSVLRSEGSVEFVEVGPSKLWMVRVDKDGAKPEDTKEMGRRPDVRSLEEGLLPLLDAEVCGKASGDETISFSFKVSLDQISDLIKRSKKCAE